MLRHPDVSDYSLENESITSFFSILQMLDAIRLKVSMLFKTDHSLFFLNRRQVVSTVNGNVILLRPMARKDFPRVMSLSSLFCLDGIIESMKRVNINI